MPKESSLVLLLARGASILTPVITIPLIITSFGSDRYGNFASLAAGTGILSVLDFGYSAILHSKIAKLNDKVEIEIFFSNVFFKQVRAILIAVAILFVFKLFEFHLTFLSTSFTTDFSEPLQAMLLGYFIYLIGNLNFKFLLARKKYFLAGCLLLVGGVVNLIATVIFSQTLKSFNAICFAAFGMHGLVFLASTPSFISKLPKLLSTGHSRILELNNQIKISTLQLAWVLGYQIDTVLVAQTIDFSSAGEYAIYQKLFFAPLSMANFFYLPVWTNSASGYDSKDRRKWYKIVLRAVLISLAMLVVCFAAIPVLSAQTFQFDLAYFLAFDIYLLLAIEAIPITHSLFGNEKWSFATISYFFGMLLNLIIGYSGLILFKWAPVTIVASSLALIFSLFVPYKISSSRR